MRKYRMIMKTTLRYIFLSLIVFLINIPIIAMIGTAFKTKEDVMTTTALFSLKPSIENFVYVLGKTNYSVYIFNSLIISLFSGILCVIIASLAGYAISRYKEKVFTGFSAFLLMLQMFPIILITIPLFIILRNMELLDKVLGIVLLYVTFFVPFSIWMFKSYFDAIPYELEEAAYIDGAGKLRAFVSIVLPIAAPAISTIMIFVFILSWNEFLLASLFLKSDSSKTISLGLQVFFTQHGADWASVQAAGVIAAFPALVFILFAEKYLVRGMTAGALKG